MIDIEEEVTPERWEAMLQATKYIGEHFKKIEEAEEGDEDVAIAE